MNPNLFYQVLPTFPLVLKAAPPEIAWREVRPTSGAAAAGHRLWLCHFLILAVIYLCLSFFLSTMVILTGPLIGCGEAE